jgi:hypothetical protein
MLSPILEVQLGRLVSSPAISANAVSNFEAASNSTTLGIDVTFTLADVTGISSITLFRNYVLDQATATAVQTWGASLSDYEYSDTSTSLQEQASAYYWLLLSPVGTSGNAVVVGPQSILLNPQLAPPTPATSISASHGAAANGTVMVTVNVTFSSPAIKIYAANYHGNPSRVAVAESSSSPLQFTLDATGETVTFTAIGVSAGGAEAASGPTTTLTLSGGATVPATPQGIVVTQLATGNQVSFPSSRDAGPTYKIYRAQRGQTFLLATLLATVTSTAGTVIYLDTAGLTGDWEYFIIATNTVGDSLPSDPAFPTILFTSATIPPNVPSNTTNTATLDSIDAGVNPLVRIYGPGGVGTSYDRITGFGSLARPNGTISGLDYATKYAIIWTGTSFIAATTYPDTLPDGYEWVGTMLTCTATGVVGTGATVTLVIDTLGHVIQANATAVGSGYVAATVNVSGGGGSGAQVQANVDGSGTIPTYTVLNGGTGYATTPTAVVVGGGSGGVSGGGGDDGGSGGYRGGCVEQGTVVEVPEGTVEHLLPCDEWIVLDLGDGALRMHPDTLVSVFKQAWELSDDDRIEVKNAMWRKGKVSMELRRGIKVKRTCPGSIYYAGPSMVRLHNIKPDLPDPI